MNNKKVLIIGANGFIGKNLKFRLKESNFEVLELDKEDNLEKLSELAVAADFIFHLAGVNRPENREDFYKGNSDLTKEILGIIKKKGLNIPILFSSSIQVEKENDYGKSKLLAESELIEYAKSTGAPIFIYRLPNIFGKWSRPNYNSFIATFCYNISRNIPIKIDDRNSMVELGYIDDVLDDFTASLNSINEYSGEYYYKLKKTYKISVGEVADRLYAFKESRSFLSVGELSDGIERALYATYLSFLDKDDFFYKVDAHEDERGQFIEFIKTKKSGQFSVSVSQKGVIRGNHYHHTKNEKFLIIKGKALLRFKNLLNNEYVEYEALENNLKVFDIPPGWAHSIENIGDSEMILLIWSNEIFDKNNPDTFSSNVKI